MKKISILFFLTFFSFILFAAAPTVSPSNLSFNSLDGARFSGSFTGGNGSLRIVVMKKGAPVEGVPVDGVDYTANSSFGTASSAFTKAGEYVVSRTSWGTFDVTNLEPGTVYYVAIFEANGSGASIQYLNVPLTGSQSTVVAPTLQASAISTTAATGNTLSLAWTKGNGSGRLLIARKASPVSVTPTDLTNYFSDAAFGNGTKIGVDNFVVYKGTGTSVTVRNLEPNTTYYFALFEYNGNISPMHLLPGAIFSAKTNAGPTAAPTSPGSGYVEGNSLTLSVSSGNGTRRLFIVRKGAPVTAVPQNGVVYTANSAFATAGSDIATDEYVVAATTGYSINVTKLEPNTVYYFRAYEYDVDNAGSTYYLTTAYAEKSVSTAITPSTVATNIKTVSVTGSSATISFTAGNGGYRTVLMKAGSAVDAKPADLSTYSSNNNFGSGAQIGTGNYVVQAGMNGTQFSVSNLQPGTTYHLSIFEYNGYNTPVYSATGGTFSFTVPLEPTAVSSRPWAAFTEGNAFRLIWTNGNGSRRLVVAKKGSAVTAKPVDQNSYTANAAFGNGDALTADEYVVYDGAGTEVNLTNLEVGTTYHFAVYEYNVGSNGLPDYLTTSWLATSFSTAVKPTVQAALTSASNITATQANINFTVGNGSSRLFIMKQGSPVTVAPQDLVRYTYQTNFGTASSLISDGNYVVATMSSGWPFTVTNLQPNTTYYVSVFEYNGYDAPAYQTASPGTTSFTTPDVPGATTPTVNASSAQTTNVDGNKLTLKWTNGNGEKRLVVMRQGGAVNFVPASATAYTANATFGSGTDLGGGQYVVYNGSGSSVDMINLSPSTSYSFAVYEYNGTGTIIRYLTTSPLTATAGTVTAPSSPATTVNASIGNGQVTLSWVNGNGSGRLLVMKEGSSVTAAPADLSVYPAGTVFKSGSQLALGEYAVYAGTGNSVTITGLENKTYFFKIFEYNGASAPVYNTTTLASGSVIVSTALPVKWLSFTAKQSADGVVLNWTTAQEVNNSSFVIERSSDGTTFQPIGTRAGAGNSNAPVPYTFTDRTPVTANVYYRIKQVDYDGKASYSPVVTISTGNREGGISVYPNPVRNQFKIELPQGVQEGWLTVSNSQGVQVMSKRVFDGELVNCSSFGSGLYFIVVEAKKKVYQERIVKQ